jgi:arsenite/tail-anchored protein-transporting ATPase
MSLLGAAVGAARFAFVVGKGGTGKTTAAGALALEFADSGADTHLISTDPAHSLGDLFGQDVTGVSVSACSPRLRLEEFDAPAAAAAWTARATEPVACIIERGTYLDGEDVAGFARLALPGVDEMMAVMRLGELSGPERVVVDTAPTGHTLRLLDAAATHAGLARALRAMAEKAAVVASALAGRSVRLQAESVIEELEHCVVAFRDDVLGRSRFVVVTRTDAVVTAETARLDAALRRRGLDVAITVVNGGGTVSPPAPAPGPGEPAIAVSWLPDARGCGGLRAWRSAQADVSMVRLGVARESAAASREAAGSAGPSRDAQAGVAAAPWLAAGTRELLLFAGKGGVGKTTCAAAAALVLAASRDVLLCSADPAGSLDDVFAGTVTARGRAGPRLRVLQIDAEAEFERLRREYRPDVMDALSRIGLSDGASLDRNVIDALWELAPPGIDEFAALAALVAARHSGETVVLDAAPTGHFLRLLSMPALALDWTRQLMRIIVKYRVAGESGTAPEALLRTARELRALQALLGDARRAGVFVVTLAESMVEAETARLLDRLDEAGIAVAGLIENRVTGVTGGREQTHRTRIRAPLRHPPPVGGPALLDFAGEWMIEP